MEDSQLKALGEAVKDGYLDEDCILRISKEALEKIGLTALELSREFEGVSIEP